jgi:hypothetical protein
MPREVACFMNNPKIEDTETPTCFMMHLEHNRHIPLRVILL